MNIHCQYYKRFYQHCHSCGIACDVALLKDSFTFTSIWLLSCTVKLRHLPSVFFCMLRIVLLWYHTIHLHYGTLAFITIAKGRKSRHINRVDWWWESCSMVVYPKFCGEMVRDESCEIQHFGSYITFRSTESRKILSQLHFSVPAGLNEWKNRTNRQYYLGVEDSHPTNVIFSKSPTGETPRCGFVELSIHPHTKSFWIPFKLSPPIQRYLPSEPWSSLLLFLPSFPWH